MAVLLSGTGRTLANFLDRIEKGALSARVCIVISSKPEAYGLEIAREHGIEAVCVDRKAYPDVEGFNQQINAHLNRHQPDLICLAGFLHFFMPDPGYRGRVMNIHPALIPAFCGKGYYGHHVHQAVLDHGVKVSGCTVHFVDEEYDHGPIILQATVPVLDDDTPDTLAARVFEKECEVYPQAVQLFAEGRLKVEARHGASSNRWVRILPPRAAEDGELESRMPNPEFRIPRERKENLNWDYDEDADVLYISLGEPANAVGLDVGEGLIIRYQEDTGEVVGLTIIGIRQRTVTALQ